MPAKLSLDLKERVERELPRLRALPEDAASLRPSGGGWSPKEELGHLIDSAVNNHARFVIAAMGPEFHGPGYAQDDWVRLHDYANQPWNKIVAWWQAHNEAMLALIANIPQDRMTAPCHIGSYPAATLQFVIEDYGVHLQHHVDHLLLRPVVTRYPQL